MQRNAYVRGDSMKTISVDDDVHERITNKKKKLLEEQKINIQLRDIVRKLVDENIDRLEIGTKQIDSYEDVIQN